MAKTDKFGSGKKGGDSAENESAGAAAPPRSRTNPASSAPPPMQADRVPGPRDTIVRGSISALAASAESAERLVASGGTIQTGDEARQTVMMRPLEAPAEVAQSIAPPEIELVQHDLPTDSPTDQRLVLVHSPDSERAAAFRVLRHHVLDQGHPQVIAVSGPHEKCGKTTTAVNLALALAESGRGRVLLVDGNLRKPELAAIFRFIPPWCFAEQLEKHRDKPFLPWGFVELPDHWLHVAAINPRGGDQHRLDAPAFAIAMERLRVGNYDHIVIDCPPVLGNADVNLIQDAADGVLLTAVSRKATTRDIQRSVEQLSPTKILGTALFEG